MSQHWIEPQPTAAPVRFPAAHVGAAPLRGYAVRHGGITTSAPPAPLQTAESRWPAAAQSHAPVRPCPAALPCGAHDCSRAQLSAAPSLLALAVSAPRDAAFRAPAQGSHIPAAPSRAPFRRRGQEAPQQEQSRTHALAHPHGCHDQAKWRIHALQGALTGLTPCHHSLPPTPSVSCFCYRAVGTDACHCQFVRHKQIRAFS